MFAFGSLSFENEYNMFKFSTLSIENANPKRESSGDFKFRFAAVLWCLSLFQVQNREVKGAATILIVFLDLSFVQADFFSKTWACWLGMGMFTAGSGFVAERRLWFDPEGWDALGS